LQLEQAMKWASHSGSRIQSINAWLAVAPAWRVALAATALHAIIYLLPNRLPLLAPRELALTWVDLRTPFVPLTAWIYWSDYALIFLAFSALTRPAERLRFVYALLTLVVLSSVIHLLFPISYPRQLFHERPPGSDAFTWAALQAFRTVDAPLSCFPSLHVGASFLAAFGSRRRSPLLLGWATLIAISTLTTKQHYFTDVVGGMALASIVWVAFRSRFTPRMESRFGTLDCT
jgi:membrane-associated phospholipid phosphatase